MKKMVLFWGVLLSTVLISCGRLKERPLNDELVIYEESSVDKTSVFMGVKDYQTDSIVIKAGPFVSITTDGNLITCMDVGGTPCVYTMDGTMFGRFDTFTHWTEDGDYYLGTDYNRSSYYFPQYDCIVRPTYSYNLVNHLFLETDGVLEIRSHYGEVKSAFLTPCVIIREKEKGIEKVTIAQKIDVNRIKVCDINLNEICTLTISQFRALQKKAFELIYVGCDGINDMDVGWEA